MSLEGGGPTTARELPGAGPLPFLLDGAHGAAGHPPPTGCVGTHEGCEGRGGAEGLGATGSMPRVAVARWPLEWIAGPARGPRQVPPRRALCRQPLGVKVWPKRAALLRGAAASPNFLLDRSLSLASLHVCEEDAAAQPGSCFSLASTSVQSGRGVAEPAEDRRASGFQVPGSRVGGRKSEAEEEGRGRVTHSNEAPRPSPFSPGWETSFGGMKATLQQWQSVWGPKAGCRNLKRCKGCRVCRS